MSFKANSGNRTPGSSDGRFVTREEAKTQAKKQRRLDAKKAIKENQ